ncbi:MAG: AzlC family ABC transporter permease [Pseudomonadota bacterium]
MSSAPGPRRAYLEGVRDGAPFSLVVGPFGFIFGVAAAEAGLDILATMAMTALVVAGASQITALALLEEGGPVFVALLAGLAVNLRMALYSAALAPRFGALPLWQRAVAAYFLTDLSYTMSELRFGKGAMGLGARLAYYLGIATVPTVFWYAMTWIGAVIGGRLPESWPLEMAIPIAFLAIVGPMLRTLPHVVTAFVSVVLALLFAGLPYSLGLLLAAAGAIAAGSLTETWLERRG